MANRKGKGIFGLLIKRRVRGIAALYHEAPNWVGMGPAREAWPTYRWHHVVNVLRLHSEDQQPAALRWRHTAIFPNLGPIAWIAFLDAKAVLGRCDGYIMGMLGLAQDNRPEIRLFFGLLSGSGRLRVDDFLVNADLRGRSLGTYALNLLDDVARSVNATSISGQLSVRDADHHRRLARFYSRHGYWVTATGGIRKDLRALNLPAPGDDR